MNKLYKSSSDKRICGVCGGIGKYLDIDSSIVRLLVVILFFAGTISFWMYIVAAIIMPSEPEFNDVSYDTDESYREVNTDNGECNNYNQN